MAKIHYEDTLNKLEQIRSNNERNSQKVVELAEPLFSNLKSSTGDQIWPIYEQAFFAALDTSKWDLAHECLNRLQTQFPTSKRVARLKGMLKEAQGLLDEALVFHETALLHDNTDIYAYKRKVAVYKAKGLNKEAINTLVLYLDSFVVDTESWMELADLYFKMNMYHQASFCYEELILLNPSNHFYHMYYAETLYILGKYPLSLKAYCRSVELCDTSMRGLYGIKSCLKKIVSKQKSDKNFYSKISSRINSKTKALSSQTPLETHQKLETIITERILDLYKESSMRLVVEDSLRTN